MNSIKPYYITTPIFYVNASPHIGHLHSALLADTQNRFQTLLNSDTFFTTGTDEHGLKIQKATEDSDFSDPLSFCDNVSRTYSDLFFRFNVKPADFIRTSENRHKKSVSQFWKQLRDNGHIEKALFTGWYCLQDETFLTERQIVEDAGSGKKSSSESGHPVEWCQEENYVFKLEPFRERIRLWLDQNNVISPPIFRNHLQMFLDQGESLPDLSVSRPSTRLHWGVPVPEDPAQTIYVWLDALVNYLTAAGYPDKMKIWPVDCHVIGKDILKFHAIYWPAFLMAADLQLPRKILCHSHWTVDGTKMSKSKGNVIEPSQLIKPYSSEGVRYFLLREAVPHSDGSFSHKRMASYLNAELANTLGNLVGRITSKSINVNQVVPQIDFDEDSNCLNELSKDLIEQVKQLPELVKNHYHNFNYYLGIDAIMDCLRKTNLYIQEEKPWELRKTDSQRLEYVLLISLESLRICAILLQPIIPKLSKQLLVKLGVPENERLWSNAERLCWNDNIKEKAIQKFSDEKLVLFQKINESENA